MLGVAEAGIMPGTAYMLSTFYRRHELAGRIGIYASFASLSGAFGGLLATGFSKIPPWGIIHTWRNIFFFEGLITMAVGVCMYFFIPAGPSVARFLTPAERELAARVIELEVLSSGPSRSIRLKDVAAAFNFPNTVMVLASAACLLTMNSLSLFVPSIINAMGYSAIRSQLLSVPPYAFATVVCIVFSIYSDRIKRRGVPMLLLLPIGMVGFILHLTVKSPGVRYFAVFLSMVPAFTGSPTLLAWSMDNSAGPTVRAVAGAIQAGFGNLGGLLATWTFLSKDARNGYKSGNAINLGGMVIAALSIAVVVLYYKWENAAREKGHRDHLLEGLTREEVENLGNKHPGFRYTL